MRGKILVVDDNLDHLRLIGYALQAAGYEVATALSGSEALTAVDGDPPSLVILDVMMPDMSGFEVCRCLRANARTAQLPILMLTAKGREEDVATGLETGADDYVLKSADLSELVARVEALLSSATRTTPSAPAV